MGKRGPPGKSAELESAQGFPGKRKRQTRAALEARNAADDLQDEARDSGFVPHPPAYLTKTARRIWGEMFSDPSTRLWFKISDHRVIARYCSLMAVQETLMRRPPAPTYDVVRLTPGGKDKPPVKTKITKRNPAYDQMLATMRELRAIEERIGGNPGARLGLEKHLRDPGDKPTTPQGTAQPEAPGGAQRKPGPLGALKPARNLN